MRKQNYGKSPNCLISEYIGSDFDHVVNVSENMDSIIEVESMDKTIKDVLVHTDNIKIVADNIDDVVHVSENINDIANCSQHSEDIKFLKPYVGDISTVADNIDSVNTVVDNLHEVTDVHNNMDAIQITSGISNQVHKVADNMGSVVHVSDHMEDIKIVADKLYEMTDPMMAALLKGEGYNVVGSTTEQSWVHKADDMIIHNTTMYKYLGSFPHQVTVANFVESDFVRVSLPIQVLNLIKQYAEQDTLPKVFGVSVVNLVNGLVITPTNNQYPKLAAFGVIYELADNSVNYTVKSFAQSVGKDCVITLSDDSLLIAKKVDAASKNWSQEQDTKVVEKTTLLTIYPSTRNLKTGDLIHDGITGFQINSAIFSVDGFPSGEVTEINSTESFVVVGGIKYQIYARDLEISSIQQLKKTAAINNQAAFVKSYHAGWAAVSDAPSGGGWFKFTNSIAHTENNGTIIKGLNGFWIRSYKEAYIPEDFGAIGVKSVEFDNSNVPTTQIPDSSDALNSLFAACDNISLPLNYGFTKPLTVPKIGCKIKGKGLYKNGLYQTNAFTGTLFQTDPAITRMWDFEASDFFIAAIGGSKVTGFRLNNPNGRCLIRRLRFTRTNLLKVVGTAFHVKRNTGASPEIIDGYFSTVEDCFVQQWNYGYHYDGSDQYVNAHWNNRCTATDGLNGWWCNRTNSIRVTNPHAELLDTAMLVQESNDLEVTSGYFERNKVASIRNQNSNACRYHDNLFSAAGYGQSETSTGAGVWIESGHQNSVKDNFFNEKFIAAHVRIGTGAIQTLVIDNSVKRRDLHGGWQADKLSLIDDGISTIFKGIVKDPDNRFFYDIKNVRLNAASLMNCEIFTKYGETGANAENPVITCGKNLTPWDANADLAVGSIYIQTGNWNKIYQRKTATGTLTNDWKEMQFV